HDSTKVNAIIASGEVADADLIIGPVYGDTFEQMAAYAHKRQIPIVSPLVSVKCNDNPFVYQMVSDESTHYDKLSSLFYGKRVVIMETGDEDKDFIDFVLRHADDCTIETFDKEVKPDEAAMAIPDDKATVYVVGTKSRAMTIQVISKLAGIKTMAGGLKDISVVASSRIARMGIDPATLFKLGVSYVTTYHVDRSNILVRKFDANYIGLFGKVPSLYAYKGYDLAMFFFGSMIETGSNFGDYMDNYYTTILQSRYKLKKTKPDGKFINTEWVLVTYTPDYNIVIQ
ncbi:MAG: ABC transporter substrate-binding protein, partial [Rikenellaceae bacterium]|nr:ABC transporter substrate-binding protein [Rikenellaceae bacterium]